MELMQSFSNYSEKKKKETEETFPNNFYKTTVTYTKKRRRDRQAVRNTNRERERNQPNLPYVSLLTKIFAN